MAQSNITEPEIKYSVLIAVHGNDDAPLFEAALNSLALQTRPVSDLVLVVDGHVGVQLTSLIEVFALRLPMNIIALEESNGLGLALKEGLPYCKYDLVGRADSDDVNLSHRFESQIAFLNENPDVDIVGTNLLEVDEANTRLKIVPQFVTLGFSTFFRNPINHQTVMYRKRVILEAGGYEDCPSFEDYLLWCKLLKEKVKISNMSEPLVQASIQNLTNKRSGHDYAVREKKFYSRLMDLLPEYKAMIFFASSMRILVRYTPNFLIKRVYGFLRVSVKTS